MSGKGHTAADDVGNCLLRQSVGDLEERRMDGIGLHGEGSDVVEGQVHVAPKVAC
jgi:hypothetical protein